MGSGASSVSSIVRSLYISIAQLSKINNNGKEFKAVGPLLNFIFPEIALLLLSESCWTQVGRWRADLPPVKGCICTLGRASSAVRDAVARCCNRAGSKATDKNDIKNIYIKWCEDEVVAR